MTTYKGRGHFRAVQLDNNFGIKDQEIIKEAEAMFSSLAYLEGIPDGNFDQAHLKEVHKHLLGDLYPWAGQYRNERLFVSGGSREASASPEMIEQETRRMLKNMAKEPVDSMDAMEFGDTMAKYYRNLYAISPFPDGNARVTRAFLDKFADQHGMSIKWEDVPAQALHVAVDQSLSGNSNSLKSIFRHITEIQDLYDLHSTKGIKDRMSSIVNIAGLRQEMIPTADFNTNDEIKRFAHYSKQLLAKDLDLFAQGAKTSLRDWEKTSISHAMSNTEDKMSAVKVFKETMESITGDRGKPRSGPGIG